MCFLVPAPLWYLICTNFLHFLKINFFVLFGTNLHYVGANLAKWLKEFMLELHLLMLQFWRILVSNISTKASKKHHIKCLISTFLVQGRCISNARFSWVNAHIYKEKSTLKLANWQILLILFFMKDPIYTFLADNTLSKKLWNPRKQVFSKRNSTLEQE